MAINLNKDGGPAHISVNDNSIYYYELNETSVGPFTIQEIIKHINLNSLVYTEKTGWKVAVEIPEIAAFFNEQVVTPIKSQDLTNAIDTKPSSLKKIVWILCIAILFFSGIYYLKSKSNLASVESPIQLRPLADSTVLKENEIFNYRKIRRYKPNPDQISNGNYYLNAGIDSLKNLNYIASIDALKKAIRCNPTGNSYYQLSKAFLQTNLLVESEKCLKMANRLRYKPKSDLSIIQAKIHFAYNNVEQLIKELSILKGLNPMQYDSLISDPKISQLVSNSMSNEIYTDEPTVNEQEGAGQENLHQKIVQQYFSDLNNKTFDIYTYFSENIDQYCLLKNPSQEDIRNAMINNSEFVNPHSEILGDRLVDIDDNTVEAWVNFSCYRTSKKKYQSCLVKTQFVFDDNNKITSYREIEIKNLQYSNALN